VGGYNKGMNQTTTQTEMNMGLTKTEEKEVSTLIRLGDSKELALETVISNRSRNADTSFYYNTYCL